MESDQIYGIALDVPADYLEEMMDAIDEVMEPVYPGYRRCFSYFPIKGTWKTMEGAHPYDGRVGEITVSDEVRLELVCKPEHLKAVLETIVRVHPYEEPGVDVIPQIAWRSFLH